MSRRGPERRRVIGLFKKAKRLALVSALGYGLAVRSLSPSLRDLVDPAWHREVPIRVTMRGLTRLLPALYDRFGEKGVRALQYVFYRIGRTARLFCANTCTSTPSMRAASAASSTTRTGWWGCAAPGRKRRREGRSRKSVIARRRGTRMLPGGMYPADDGPGAGTFSVLNPDLEVPELSKLLSTGDDCCLATIELPCRKRTPARFRRKRPLAPSPRTQSARPGGQAGSAGIKSVLAALWTILTKGPEQPMHWYEHLRYVP